MPSVLEELQTAAVARLASSRALAPVKVLHERIGNIEAIVENALARATGLVAIVMTASARSSSPSSPGPRLDSVTLVVEVIENVALNAGPAGTRIPASFVAEQAAALLHLHLWAPGRTLCFEAIDLRPNDAGLLVYAVSFSTSATLVALP